MESRNVEEVEVEVETHGSRVSRGVVAVLSTGVEVELAANLVGAVGRKTDVFEVAVSKEWLWPRSRWLML